MKIPASLLLVSLPSLLWAAPGLTVYNQDFGVVRESITLDLKPGTNEVKFDGATLRLEPDSVILRDSSGAALQVLEQNYRNDPLSQGFLLSLFEGKTIEFYVHESNKPDRVIQGKVIRSGYSQERPSEPIIEAEGKIRFGLPGEPVFASLGDDTILKPQLLWKINAQKEQRVEAEVAYVTAGLSWEASYNLVSPEKGNEIDLVGWVTMKNETGREFADAQIKLMAGDVKKLVQEPPMARAKAMMRMEEAAAVTEKAFDEYHLYSLERPTTLRDGQTKQVEFVRGHGVQSELVYIYDALNRHPTKISVRREFKNSQQNGLGVPLPKGKIRFYRTDGAQLQFTGENQIDHTPANEMLKVYTGEAFDLVGERRMTQSTRDSANRRGEESYEIVLRNRKAEPVDIVVVEHFNQWANWAITAKSEEFTSRNASEIEFKVKVNPGEERKVSYTMRYSW